MTSFALRSGVGVDVVVFENDVPTITAVAAAIGHDVADQPFAVLSRWSEEMGDSTAVDADALGRWLLHRMIIA